jgi:hypothetical protein
MAERGILEEMGDYRIAALREMERRLNQFDKIKTALDPVDNQDWEYLLSLIPDGGRGRFWKTVIADFRSAVAE